MKLLGIVILYYPDDAVVKNIATYLAQLDELMLWDNTPAADRRDLDLDSLGDGRGKIIQDGCGENLGIGTSDCLRRTYLYVFGRTQCRQHGRNAIPCGYTLVCTASHLLLGRR